MKYYLIVGEASGDLHASHLMTALKAEDLRPISAFSAEIRWLPSEERW